MKINFLMLVASTILFRIITLNLFFVVFSACVRFYRKFFSLREKVLQAIVNIQVPIYMHLMPKNKKWKYSKADLRTFPKGTLGNDVAQFLDTNNFELIPFLETHDVYHVLFNYKTTISDEARLYFFLFGNRKFSFEVLGTVAISIILLPELIFDFEKHYQRGKNCESISHWKMQSKLHFPTEVLRAKIFRDER